MVATVCSVLAAPHDPQEPAHHDVEASDHADHVGPHNVNMLDFTRPGQLDPLFGRVSVSNISLELTNNKNNFKLSVVAGSGYTQATANYSSRQGF